MSDFDKVTAIAMVSTKLVSEDDEKVAQYKQGVDKLERLCHAVIGSRSGTVTKLPASLGIGDCFELGVPADRVEGLRELADRSRDETGVEIVIGIGHDIHEAKCAAEAALDSDSDILVYHPDMDDISKYMDEVDDLKKADPISEAKKILRDIKQNTDLYEQLRAKNPEAYRAVVDTLQSLVQAVAAQKEDEENDGKQAKEAQSAMSTHDGRHERNHVKQAKDAVKEAMSETPIRKQPEPQEEEQSGPEQLQPKSMSPKVLQALMDMTKKKYREEKSGSMMHDEDIESQDYDYSDDPEFSKSLRYVLEYGSLYG